MPRKTDLPSFGSEYEQLLLRAHADLITAGKGEFTVQFENPNIALSMRGRVYAYFRALRQSTARPDLTALCDGIGIRAAGSAMVMFRDEDALDRVRLRNALGLAPGFDQGIEIRGVLAPESGHSSNLDRLREIRERKTTKG